MTVLKRLTPIAIVAAGLSGAIVILGASGGPTAPQAIDVSAPLPEDSWQSGNFPGDVLTVTADPSNPAIVYASRNEDGVYKSTNGGASWGAINTGIFGTSGGRLYIFSLAIQPGTPSVLLAAVGGSGVFRSTTAGASWSKQLTMDGEVVAFDRVNLNTAYAGANSTGLFRTFNAGATWQAFQPNSFYCGAYTWDIIPDPLAGGHAYAEVVETNLAPSAGSGRLFVETFNSGSSCSLATFPGLPAGALVAKLGISAGGDAYAGTYSNGLYVRRVGTTTYTLLDATIPSAIVDMAFEPAATRRVYLGTAANGVYRCDTTCTPFSTGLADLRIRKLSLSTPPGRLYVATPTGLFSRGVDLSNPYPSCTVSALTVGAVEASVPGDLAAADCTSPNRLGRKGDVFSFQGTAGSRVRFSLRRGQGAAAAYDPYLILSGPDGQVLAFNDNVDSVCPLTTGNDACINYTLPATGTYYVEATSTSLVTVGAPYALFYSGVPAPTLTLDKASLRFGAVGSATSFVAQGTAQTTRLTQTGLGTVTWTASSSQPWLLVSPPSGTGSANLSISITPASGLPPSGWASAAITFTAIGAVAPQPIGVVLTLVAPAASAKPQGVIDTPTNNATGVTGAVPFTGWALDDTEVTRVMICRGAFGAEVAPVDPNCGGAAQIYVGDGVFIDGARPDVQATFPAFPRNSRAGWGFMVLTNMLPAQGNGTYVFYAYARDAEGNNTLLGTRTITCDNAHGNKPFGAIDTPTQGGTTSGASFVNFGWALTQNPKFIPTDGSTINVLVDGAFVGKADYNHFRSDIAGIFPGLANSNAAVGFRILDTTALANGLHTISWAVTDNTGAIEGIGSRFFTVANGAGAAPVPAAAVEAGADDRGDSGAAAVSAPGIAAAPIDETPLIGRRGWDLDAPWRRYAIGRSGRAVMRGEEIDRFELWLGAGEGASYTGYLRVGQALAPLPIGSRLEPGTGSFTWAPGVGFVGPYDLVFVRWSGATAIARHEVRIILAAKGSGHVGVQVAIDAPRPQQAVEQPFLVGGWAVDLDAAAGTGIETLHVWAYPVAGGKPVFLGATSYGGARPDVGAVHGDQFRDAGFGLMVQGLAAGSYDLAVFPWSNVIGSFAPPSVVRVTVR